MKIILISASPRKKDSRTLALAKNVLLGCKEKGAQTEIVHLRDFRVEFCRHCEFCHKKILCCPIKDRIMALAKKLLRADGIIFATPNYINQVTGSLKTLFDRYSHFIHCKRFLGKYIAAVVTSGSGYDIPVLRYLKYYSILCGGQFSGGIYSRQDKIKENIFEAIKLGKKLVSDIQKIRCYPGQLKRIEKGKQHFKRVIQAHKRDWKEEYLYWQEKGWL